MLVMWLDWTASLWLDHNKCCIDVFAAASLSLALWFMYAVRIVDCGIVALYLCTEPSDSISHISNIYQIPFYCYQSLNFIVSWRYIFRLEFIRRTLSINVSISHSIFLTRAMIYQTIFQHFIDLDWIFAWEPLEKKR